MTKNDCVCYHWCLDTFKGYIEMTNEPYALRLADRLNAWPDAEELDDAAAELRRLYDENLRLRGIVPEALEKLNDELCDENDRLHALNAQLTQVSEELLETLKELTADYADRFDLDNPSTNPGIKFYVKLARAAISHAESTLKTE